jgi:hypothetical protein
MVYREGTTAAQRAQITQSPLIAAVIDTRQGRCVNPHTLDLVEYRLERFDGVAVDKVHDSERGLGLERKDVRQHGGQARRVSRHIHLTDDRDTSRCGVPVLVHGVAKSATTACDMVRRGLHGMCVCMCVCVARGEGRGVTPGAPAAR